MTDDPISGAEREPPADTVETDMQDARRHESRLPAVRTHREVGDPLRILVLGETHSGHTVARLLHSAERYCAVTLCQVRGSTTDDRVSVPGSDWPTVPSSIRHGAIPRAVNANALAVRVAFTDGTTGYYDLLVGTPDARPLVPDEPRVIVLGKRSLAAENGSVGAGDGGGSDGGTESRDSTDRARDGLVTLAEVAVLASLLAAGGTIPDTLRQFERFRQRFPALSR